MSNIIIPGLAIGLMIAAVLGLAFTEGHPSEWVVNLVGGAALMMIVIKYIDLIVFIIGIAVIAGTLFGIVYVISAAWHLAM
jgi:hypothetical protein